MIMTFDGISKDIVSKFFETARTSTILEYKQILTASLNSSGLLNKLRPGGGVHGKNSPQKFFAFNSDIMRLLNLWP